jgi:acyl-lipid omega-6 desaturase (Delta-12 desaturase)
MDAQLNEGNISSDTTGIVRALARYRNPKAWRSIGELLITILPFLSLWFLAWLAVEKGYWIGLLLVLPAAGLLVRLFIIQHDCGHGSFFRYRTTNDCVGRIISAVTLTPYDSWRHAHALHHANSGNLDRRGVGDVGTLTVAEFQARSRLGRFLYRLYRHPIVMFGIGPAYLFLVRHRLPIEITRSDWRLWLSVMATNAVTVSLIAGMAWLVGIGMFLLIHLPITLLAASIGVWLFYIQHQFERTSWKSDADWTFQEAALRGSSHYDLPSVLRWFTGNIGIHHVHHLSSRIPYYRLPEVLRDHPRLIDASRITLSASLRSVNLVLWDEKKQQLVTFKEGLASDSLTSAG